MDPTQPIWIKDPLAILADALDPATPPRRSDDFVAAITSVEQIAPAFRASRLIMRRVHATQPADWINALVACAAPAVALIDLGKAPGSVRRAIGAARKSMREPVEILPALLELRRSLDEDPCDPSLATS